MGDFLLGIQREKMAFGSVFFVSRAVVRGSEILRRVPQQIWCQKNATFSSCPSWYIYTQSLTPTISRPAGCDEIRPTKAPWRGLTPSHHGRLRARPHSYRVRSWDQSSP